ncbi:facilitated trehalose transporter Tret1-like isoform X1 [Cephus cinctus]|uniref:Facilitated trehalose transporter Tret1-like isoform X1 n=3 Tax=Cephus cinctus TaxID=211228 RepID=A0AAJ7BR23_CEPCN|nr:facilitated trehalose transporter Tret1-like isoform X1 [Cephus cinctus]
MSTEKKVSNSRIGTQLLAGVLANLSIVVAGTGFGWTSPSLPKIVNDENEFPVTPDQSSWIATALIIGIVFGPIVSLIIVDRVGRKSTLLATAFPSLICWILIYFAQSYKWLMIGRFINGIAVGMTYTTIPLYVGEIAQVSVRGALGTISNICYNVGTLICFSIGPFVTRQTLALICMTFPILFFISFFWMPETPYFYLMRKRGKSAEKSLFWLRDNKDVKDELQEMTDLVEIEQRNKGRLIDLAIVKGNRKATIIVLGIFSAQQFSGISAIQAYGSIIFNQSDLQLNSDIVVIIMGMVTLVSSSFTTLVVDRFGRKPLMIVSTFGCSLCLLFIAIYFHLKYCAVDISVISWLPVVTMILFFIFYSFGNGPLPYAVLGEIYPTNVKAWATMLISIYSAIIGSIVTKIYQIVADGWGEHAIFYTFAVVEIIFLFFIIFVMFETKGKSFREIQEHLGASVIKHIP